MQRLSANDRVMLWPDALWPQEVAALALLDGTSLLDANGRLRIEAVRAVIGGRLHRVPRLRQVLYRPRRGLGGPLWVDAPTFDIADHVRSVPVPVPGDEAALLRTVEHLRRQRLDSSRPLWQLCVLTGLPDNQLGLFVKIHHAVADGIAAIATVGVFLDPAPDMTASTAPRWSPAQWPTTTELFADNARSAAARLGQAAATMAHPVTMARRLHAIWSHLRSFAGAVPGPYISLNHAIGADRRLAFVRGRLEVVADMAHANHATINDVLLAAIAGGLRALLSSRGEPVDRPVAIDVPITLRPTDGRDQARGNRISQMIISLPVDVADPDLRLQRIAAQTAAGKRENHPPVGRVLGNRLARRMVLKELQRHPVNVTSADLPGPTLPRYLAGARVLEVFPVLPLMANVSLGVGALSYAGQFTIGVTADRDTYPDLDVFTAGVRDELAAATMTGFVRTSAE